MGYHAACAPRQQRRHNTFGMGNVGIQSELAEKLANSDRMNEAFMLSMTRGD